MLANEDQFGGQNHHRSGHNYIWFTWAINAKIEFYQQYIYSYVFVSFLNFSYSLFFFVLGTGKKEQGYITQAWIWLAESSQPRANYFIYIPVWQLVSHSDCRISGENSLSSYGVRSCIFKSLKIKQLSYQAIDTTLIITTGVVSSWTSFVVNNKYELVENKIRNIIYTWSINKYSLCNIYCMFILRTRKSDAMRS